MKEMIKNNEIDTTKNKLNAKVTWQLRKLV